MKPHPPREPRYFTQIRAACFIISITIALVAVANAVFASRYNLGWGVLAALSSLVAWLWYADPLRP